MRSYDPQIGRFLQNDPYDQFASGYVGMGNDPGNLTDEDGGCAGCKISATASKQVAGVGYNSVVTFKRVTSTTVSFSKVMAEANTALNVIDATSNTLSKTLSKDDLINQSKNKVKPQPARSFVNPPDVETVNNYPLAAAAQWFTNFVWEASGAKETEIYIKDRISGYKEGNIIEDTKAIIDAGTILTRPGKPGKVGSAEPKKFNNVQQNKKAGDAFRDKILIEKQAEWGDEYELKTEQQSKVVDRVHDISVYPKGSKKAIYHYETKKGKSPYKSSQRIKDAIIEQKTGAKTELIRGN